MCARSFWGGNLKKDSARKGQPKRSGNTIKKNTKTIPVDSTVVVIDEFGDLGDPNTSRHRYFGFAVSVVKNPKEFAGHTEKNRKRFKKEIKAKDDESRDIVIDGIREQRVGTHACYVDKNNAPRWWSRGKRKSDSMQELFSHTLDETLPDTGNVLVITDHHSGYKGNAESIIGSKSNERRIVKGGEYNSASGPYSDLLQTQDYVAYAASAAVEYGNRSYSDRLKMSFKKFLRRDK